MCYFWDEFKIHSTDVYHRYITSDLSLACEIVLNSNKILAIKDITNVPKAPPTYTTATRLAKPLSLPKQSSGYVYCVAPSRPDVNIMKVGHWKSSLDKLERRYITYYGKDLILHTRFVPDCRQLEYDTLSHFHDNRLSGELFPKTCWAPIVEHISQANV